MSGSDADADGEAGPSVGDEDIGREVRTHSRTITEADVANFAGVSGDFNPLHLSRSAGEDSPYGERVVHGALQFSICTGLLWQRRHDRPETVAFYGVDRLRFRRAVRLGETVRAEAELVDVEPFEHPTANALVRYEARLVVEAASDEAEDDDGDTGGEDADADEAGTAGGEVALSCELLSLVR